MTRLLTAVLFALVAGAAPAADDKPRPDADAKVAEGAEVSLTPAEITSDKEQPDQGPRAVTAKAGKAGKVKMPARAYQLGFTGEPQKGGGIKVVGLASPSGLVGVRAEAGGRRRGRSPRSRGTSSPTPTGTPWAPSRSWSSRSARRRSRRTCSSSSRT
jgi:hypothetical protein